MSPLIAIAVLFAALLHATWNAMIKVSGDRLVIMAVTVAFASLIVSPALFVLPAPSPESWPFLGLSMVFHATYMLLLVRAYGHGDFVQIYPLARGSAPMLTALLGFLLLGESLDGLEILGMLIIVGSILGFAGERIGGIKQLSGAALTYSLLTGVSIAGYTLVDGSGARIAGNTFSFMAWMFFLDGLILPVVAIFRRREKLLPTVKSVWKPALGVAIISSLGYGIVVWGFTLERIAMVAVLRETSVAFAALISAFLIKEKLTPVRIRLVTCVVLGVVLLGA